MKGKRGKIAIGRNGGKLAAQVLGNAVLMSWRRAVLAVFFLSFLRLPSVSTHGEIGGR
jgi:hypothetical protein